MRNDNNDDNVNLREGSGDSKEKDTTNFMDDVINMVGGVNMEKHSTHSSEKIKQITYSIKKGERKIKRGSRVGAQFVDCFNRLLDSVSIKNECTSTGGDIKGCSIARVMDELHSVDGIVKGGDFHC